MARAKKPKDVNERMLEKLERIEDLLVTSAFLVVTDHRITPVSVALKRERRKKK